jgi:hypothetical protein
MVFSLSVVLETSVGVPNRWDTFGKWEVIRQGPDLVIPKERQHLRNLFPVEQDFSLALEMTKASQFKVQFHWTVIPALWRANKHLQKSEILSTFVKC